VGKITSIKPQKKKGRFNIFIDGVFAFGIDEINLAANRLVVGKEISPEEKSRLEKESAIGKLFESVLRFLSFRPRSETEVRRFLTKKEADPEEQQQVVSHAKALGFLDDQKFAEWWVTQRQTFRPKGIRAVKHELQQKGIDRLILNSLETSPETEISQGKRLMEKKLPQWRHLPPRDRRKKALEYLLRRGFSWEAAKTAVDLSLSDELE
jgi:regulatory protein